MAQLTVDIGGSPGKDCRGYCEYCYFRHAKDVPPFGCRYCPPFQKGCDYCSRGVKEQYPGFRNLRDVAEDTLARLQMLSEDVSRITISGGGDPSCYPRFTDLIELLGSMESPLHIGYTSGKGFDNPGIAKQLLDNGLSEVSFTVFASDPGLRRRHMHDPTPEVSLAVLEKLCDGADVYAAAVILPGVNDGDALEATCSWLEERGAKGLILMRFANTREQGLILGNEPVLSGQKTQSVEEFRSMITDLSGRYSLKISGTPLWDPDIGSPFAILTEPYLLEKLPKIQKKATLITGSVAAPFIDAVLSKKGDNVTVVPVSKEIACLITKDDIEELDLRDLGKTVIIPGRSFVYDREIERLLRRDGIERVVIRGPEMLTADAETSMGMTRDQVLSLEFDGFSDLIRCINLYGE
ncbi:MAG: methyl coenzyme M reductase-arginine methyltransferase Mmp10 [Methanoregulaceae archaeon]